MSLTALIPVLLLGFLFVGTLLACIFAPQLPTVLRVLAAMCLVPVILFCGYGFLATLEPLDPATQMTWRVIYSLIAISCIGAIARLAFAKRCLT